jgi:hypothetical protein
MTYATLVTFLVNMNDFIYYGWNIKFKFIYKSIFLEQIGRVLWLMDILKQLDNLCNLAKKLCVLVFGVTKNILKVFILCFWMFISSFSSLILKILFGKFYGQFQFGGLVVHVLWFGSRRFLCEHNIKPNHTLLVLCFKSNGLASQMMW